MCLDHLLGSTKHNNNKQSSLGCYNPITLNQTLNASQASGHMLNDWIVMVLDRSDGSCWDELSAPVWCPCDQEDDEDAFSFLLFPLLALSNKPTALACSWILWRNEWNGLSVGSWNGEFPKSVPTRSGRVHALTSTALHQQAYRVVGPIWLA